MDMNGSPETPEQSQNHPASFYASAKTLAHISDLHIGKSAKHLEAAKAICHALIAALVDMVIVTGDVTEHGLKEEYRKFEEIFQDLFAQNKLLVVPGNHDRWGDDVGQSMMHGMRVSTTQTADACLIGIDSTEPRNHLRISGHGTITEYMMRDIEGAVTGIPQNTFVVLALHHHLLPQPEDLWIEKISNLFRLPFAKELYAGQQLITRLRGKCNLILHGHRHTLKETAMPGDRVLGIYNAGATTLLGGFRIFTYQNGQLVGEPRWVMVR